MSNDYLFPLRKKPKIQKFASFDVETQNITNDFYMVGVYHDSRYEAFYDVDSFYDYIKTRLKGYWITATNLGFDITACFYNTKYWKEFVTISNGGFMLMAKNDTLDIQFIDTLNYHKASVKQLGEILGDYKLEAPSFLGQRQPENPIEEAELREYNRQDCVISHDFMVWFQDVINKIGGELKITIASTSMDVFKRKFLDRVLVKEDRVMEKRGLKTNLKDKIFNAYYGGRTEVLQRGYFENLNYYDFNSIYPSVMTQGLPLPNSVQYKENGCIWSIKNRHGVSKVTIEHITDELPLLPYRHNKRLMFPTGKMTGWWTHIEIREAIKNGYVLTKVHETISYSLTFFPFDKYINILYDKRNKAKKNGSSEQLIYKILMNSLYGKFGERKHNVMQYFDKFNMSDKEYKKIKETAGARSVTMDENGKGYFTYDEECNSSHVLPILPVYITALARIKLWKTARLVDPVYMDTDSIVTKSILPSSKKLGELEREYRIDKGVFIKPKMYWFEDDGKNIVKMKGVPKSTIDQFNLVLKGKKITYNKFVKLKESIRRNLKVNSVIEQSKLLDLEDIKREWGEEFTLHAQRSKPRRIQDDIQDKEIRNENEQSVLLENSITA